MIRKNVHDINWFYRLHNFILIYASRRRVTLGEVFAPFANSRTKNNRDSRDVFFTRPLQHARGLPQNWIARAFFYFLFLYPRDARSRNAEHVSPLKISFRNRLEPPFPPLRGGWLARGFSAPPLKMLARINRTRQSRGNNRKRRLLFFRTVGRYWSSSSSSWFYVPIGNAKEVDETLEANL